MTWFKTDDGFWRSRKVRRLAADKLPAVGLWALCGNWAADNLETNVADGFVPWEVIESFGDVRRRYAKRLLDVGLWEPVTIDGEEGVLFHDWAEYNPTREEKEAEREAWRRKKANQRGKDRVSPGDNTGDTLGDDDRDSTEDSPGDSPPPSTGESTPPSTGESRKSPVSRPVPSRPVPVSPDGDTPPAAPTAQTIVGEWIDRCAKRPPGAVIGQISKQVKALLAEGIDADDVRRGLAAWMAKNLHPGTLPSVVNEVMNQPRPATNGHRPSTTDARVAAAQALKARFANDPDPFALPAGGTP